MKILIIGILFRNLRIFSRTSAIWLISNMTGRNFRKMPDLKTHIFLFRFQEVGLSKTGINPNRIHLTASKNQMTANLVKHPRRELIPLNLSTKVCLVKSDVYRM